MIYRPAYDENDNEEKLCTELLDLKNIGDMVLEMQEGQNLVPNSGIIRFFSYG